MLLRDIIMSSQTPQELGKTLASTPLPGFAEDVWEEISEDIPATDDPIIQKYLAGRASLIEQEGKRRSGTTFRHRLAYLVTDPFYQITSSKPPSPPSPAAHAPL